MPIKNTRGRVLTDHQRTVNALRPDTRALAERGNSLLKTTFQGAVPGQPLPPGALRDHRRRPRSLHHQHDRAT